MAFVWRGRSAWERTTCSLSPWPREYSPNKRHRACAASVPDLTQRLHRHVKGADRGGRAHAAPQPHHGEAEAPSSMSHCGHGCATASARGSPMRHGHESMAGYPTACGGEEGGTEGISTRSSRGLPPSTPPTWWCAMSHNGRTTTVERWLTKPGVWRDSRRVHSRACYPPLRLPPPVEWV